MYQLKSLLNSELVKFIRSCRLSAEQRAVLSSAYKKESKVSVALYISLIKTRNSNTPRMEPCKTPIIISHKLLEEVPFTCTLCFLPEL